MFKLIEQRFNPTNYFAERWLSKDCEPRKFKNGSILRKKEIRVQAEVKQFTCIGCLIKIQQLL